VSFGLPPGTVPPDAPQPVASGEWFPHIIAQVRQDDGTVLVTFAMPRLARFTVRVPLSSWLDGEHMRLAYLPDPLLRVLAIEQNDSTPEDDSRD
jgi:hypothetical protein